LSVIRDGTRFLRTIIWTALQYNPARILELAGFAAFSIAGFIGLLLVAARLQGITDLGPHLVALFHHRAIHQANLVTQILGPSPERHFGWLGLALAICGSVLASVSLYLGVAGWEITRLWLWLLGSALFVLVGVQLMLFWTLIQVLDALDGREEQIGADMLRAEKAAAAIPVPRAVM
jgi:hypothetical protein